MFSVIRGDENNQCVSTSVLFFQSTKPRDWLIIRIFLSYFRFYFFITFVIIITAYYYNMYQINNRQYHNVCIYYSLQYRGDEWLRYPEIYNFCLKLSSMISILTKSYLFAIYSNVIRLSYCVSMDLGRLKVSK